MTQLKTITFLFLAFLSFVLSQESLDQERGGPWHVVKCPDETSLWASEIAEKPCRFNERGDMIQDIAPPENMDHIESEKEKFKMECEACKKEWSKETCVSHRELKGFKIERRETCWVNKLDELAFEDPCSHCIEKGIFEVSTTPLLVRVFPYICMILIVVMANS
jgi:hypothetical protein